MLVYGVLYVVMEMVGQQLAVVGWPQVTALDVATALTDAFLVLAIAAAVLLTAHLGIRWWLRRRADRPVDVPLPEWDDEPIEVTAWRPTAEEMASPPPPPPPPPTKGTYGGNPYSFAGRRWPTDDGRQL